MSSLLQTEPSSGRAKGTRFWTFVVLSILVATVPYLTSLSYGFVYDDHLALEENSYMRIWPGLDRIFLSGVWTLSSLSKESNYYRPMFVLAYEVVSHTAGVVPWAFHLLNIVFHAAATTVVFLLTFYIWRKESTAAIAALLFALHPVHVEPVAWIAALSELAYTLFVLLAVYAYAQDRKSSWFMPLSLLFYAIALLWKESAIAFIPIVLFYDILALRRWRWMRWISVMVVSLAYLGARASVLGGLAPATLHAGMSINTQVWTAISNVGFYVKTLLAPTHLSAFYSPEFVHGMTIQVFGVLLLAALIIWKLRGKTTWAAAWIVAALFPVLLVSRIAVPLADRDLYLPSVGFVWLAALWIETLPRKFGMAVLAVLTVAYGTLTVQRLPLWHDDQRLLLHEVQHDPENTTARLLLASELGRQGQIPAAITQLEEILKREPDNREALESKAGVLVSSSDWPGTRATCRIVLQKWPNSARCLLNMGFLEEQEGKLELAHVFFVKALEIDPDLLQALLHQGVVEARMGNLSQAATTLERAVERNPTAPALNNLGSVYADGGHLEKAAGAFRRAVQVDPSFEVARENLERAVTDLQANKAK